MAIHLQELSARQAGAVDAGKACLNGGPILHVEFKLLANLDSQQPGR